MKKLFSILTTSVLTLTATISTIACNGNTTDNKKDSANEDEKTEQLFKDKVNTFLSTLKFELEGKKDKDMRITDPKSGWNFIIERSEDTTQSQEKEFKTVNDLTDKIWPDKKNYENDIVEIITGFAVTKSNIPKDKDLKEKARITMPKTKSNWSHKTMDFFEGSVEIKAQNKEIKSKQTLLWKMGYLKKEIYFKALYQQALTYYFHSSLDRVDNEDYLPFLVEKNVVFDEQWIKKCISDYIDSDAITKNKGDDKLKKTLSNLYKDHSNFLKEKVVINNEHVDKVIPNGKWNKDDNNRQWVHFEVIFTNNKRVYVDFWLKPKNQN